MQVPGPAVQAAACLSQGGGVGPECELCLPSAILNLRNANLLLKYSPEESCP